MKKGPLACLALPFYSVPDWYEQSDAAATMVCIKCRQANISTNEPHSLVLAFFSPLPQMQVEFACYACVNPYKRGGMIYANRHLATKQIRSIVQRLWSRFGPTIIITRGQCYMCEARISSEQYLCTACGPAMRLMRLMDPKTYGKKFPRTCEDQVYLMLSWFCRVNRELYHMQHLRPTEVALYSPWAALRLNICYACINCERPPTRICKCHAMATCSSPVCIASAKERHRERCPGPWYTAFALDKFLV